jgi:hypothetical protein
MRSNHLNMIWMIVQANHFLVSNHFAAAIQVVLCQMACWLYNKFPSCPSCLLLRFCSPFHQPFFAKAWFVHSRQFDSARPSASKSCRPGNAVRLYVYSCLRWLFFFFFFAHSTIFLETNLIENVQLQVIPGKIKRKGCSKNQWSSSRHIKIC